MFPSKPFGPSDHQCQRSELAITKIRVTSQESSNVDTIKAYWDEYLDILEEELAKSEKEYYNPELLEKFLKMGLCNMQSSKGETIMHLIGKLRKGSFEGWEEKYQPNYNLQDSQGRTPIHLACLSRDSLNLFFISKSPNDPTIQDNEGRTPLHFAFIESEEPGPNEKSTLGLLAEKISVLTTLHENFPGCRNSYLIKDNYDKTPQDYATKELMDLYEFLIQIKEKANV